MKLHPSTASQAGKPKSRAQRKYFRIILWIVAVVLIIVAVAVSLFFYDVNVGFGAPAHPSFVGYRPTVLPNGIKIVGQSLTRQHMTGMDIWNFYYSLKLNSNDLLISETQKDDAEPNTVSCQGYGGYCTIYHTPTGYVYRVWYSTDNNKPYGMAIDSTEGNTDVDISVDDSVTRNYLAYNWNGVFDSMLPVNLNHTPYSKYTSCGCGG